MENAPGPPEITAPRDGPASTGAGEAAARRNAWLAFAAVCALALALRAPLAGLPLERDEGEYAYIAQRWLLGEVPYQESFDQKPPGVFAAYALIFRAMGQTAAAIHWGAQIYTLGTLGVLFLLGRRLFSPQAGIAAAAFAAVMVVDHSLLGNAANTETFMLLPMAGAFLAALIATERNSSPWSLAAGSLSVAAILFKQVAATNLLLCFLWIAWRPDRRVRLAAAFAAGCVLALLPVVAYFAASGALMEFFDATVGHNLRYSGRIGLSEYPAYFWLSFAQIARSLWAVGLLALVGFARAFRRPDGEAESTADTERGRVALVAAWGLLSLLGVTTGGYFRSHYFLQLVPAVALLAGHGAATFSHLIRRRTAGSPEAAPVSAGPRRVALWASAFAIAATLLGAPWYYLRSASAEKCRRIYGDNPFPESILVGRYIAEHSNPDETVFIFGSEPQILFYANRKSASRYIFVYPLMAPFADAQERQRAVVEEVERNRPRFLVTVFVLVSFSLSPDTHTEIFDRLSEIAAKEYRVVGITPFRAVSPFPLITGETAVGMWKATPMSYAGPTWASMVIWERVASE